MKSPTKNIGVCSMTFKDINDVLEIQNESNLSRWKYADYLREIENNDSINLVAEFENKVIGFAIVRLLAAFDESANAYDSAEIYNIAVSESFQNKGAGQKLFGKIVDKLNNQSVAEVWLEVRESNKNAIKFYYKNGFTKEFVRKNYYQNPSENAYVLKLSVER